LFLDHIICRRGVNPRPDTNTKKKKTRHSGGDIAIAIVIAIAIAARVSFLRLFLGGGVTLIP